MIDFNYLKLGITIFLSILLSGSLLTGLQFYVNKEFPLETQTHINVEPIVKFIERPVSTPNYITTSKVSSPNYIKTTPIVNSLNQLDELQKKKASIRTTNRETCEYWKSQYQKSKNEVSKMRMQSSCARAASY